jgi:hypothetical protein
VLVGAEEQGRALPRPKGHLLELAITCGGRPGEKEKRPQPRENGRVVGPIQQNEFISAASLRRNSVGVTVSKRTARTETSGGCYSVDGLI